MEQYRASNGTIVQSYFDHGAGQPHASDAVLVQAAQVYTATARSWQLGTFRACEFCDVGDAVVTPLRPGVATGGFYLGVLLDGRGSLTQWDESGASYTVDLGPDRVGVYARRHPFLLRIDGPYRYLVLEISPAALGIPAAAVQAASRDLHLANGPSALLLTGLLHQLSGATASLSVPLRIYAGQALAALVTGHLRTNSVDGSPPAFFDRVLAHIERQLNDPELCPDAIAAAHHISTRHLHKLFHGQAMTVAGYLRSRRLELVHRDLADPLLMNLSVSAIGSRHGLPDPSQLSKAFRARYGSSPRQYRASLSAPPAGPPSRTGPLPADQPAPR